MSQFPRGISPELLLSQVKNTMPYLFASSRAKLALSNAEVGDTALGRLPNAALLRSYETDGLPAELSHFEYFRLCVSCHYLTCATPVPTDVDNQIRHKLWPPKLPLDIAIEMTDYVLSTRKWDFTQLSRRYTYGAPGTAWEKEALPGHLGEWFTIAAAAYCALRKYKGAAAASKAQEVFDAITDEIHRHSEIFGSLWRINDGLGCLRASANVSHNFGDLDRVMDMWELSQEDPLRLQYYKLTASPFGPDKKLRYMGRLWVAGELYKSEIMGSSMAAENHRHFALRRPRCLRAHPDLMIHNGPFFDDWGKTVARHLATPEGNPSQETLEVIEAMTHGWERLSKTVGYGRALHGIAEVHPNILDKELFKNRAYRNILEMSQEKFEKKWNEEALKLLDDIPSRA